MSHPRANQPRRGTSTICKRFSWGFSHRFSASFSMFHELTNRGETCTMQLLQPEVGALRVKSSSENPRQGLSGAGCLHRHHSCHGEAPEA